MELTFYTALLIGLLGSTHCVGMCGGIVGVLGAGPPRTRRPRVFAVTHHLTYNAGRILSYVAAGTLAGLIGSQLSSFSPSTVAPIGRLIAGLFMIAIGLYLAGWWRAIAELEKIGLYAWRRIEPLGRRFLPAKTPMRALGLGLVWGWLPCGLVYSALALAMTSSSPRQGALIMFGFGLGTLPALLAMAGVAGHLVKIMRHPALRRVTGAGIVLFGLYTCFIAFTGHERHRTDPNQATDWRESSGSASGAGISEIIMKQP